MANHLAPFLNDLVAAIQSAFIRGRCIYDNFILVQQNIKLLHCTRVSSLFLKLDISKAFDLVSVGHSPRGPPQGKEKIQSD